MCNILGVNKIWELVELFQIFEFVIVKCFKLLGKKVEIQEEEVSDVQIFVFLCVDIYIYKRLSSQRSFEFGLW